MKVDIEELKEIANNYEVTFATVMRVYQRISRSNRFPNRAIYNDSK